MTAVRPPAIGWDLPSFYCPLDDFGRHPLVDVLDEQAFAWADSFGLYPNNTERSWARAIHNADFVGRMMPRGSAETLLLFLKWNYWAWSLDDWHDSAVEAGRTSQVVDHSVRVLRTLECADSTLLGPGSASAALIDLAQDTRATLTPYQMHRLCNGTRDWLMGACWQTRNTEQRVMPTLNDFAAVRMSVNGTFFSLAFSEVANDIHVPPAAQHAAPVRALTDSAGFIVGCDNDLFSYAQDDHHNPCAQNLVNVIAHHTGSTPREALRPAVALRDRAMTLFTTLREQVGRDADEPLQRYLDALGQYIAGCIRWMSAAPRYASPRNRHPLPVVGARYDITITDHPSDPSTAAPPIPSIAWWWTQLDASAAE
ncbi:terpene synthase family protein [Streptomyces sp. 21So2-11]|uniref:terpene synthase family protein n=1 Tax=Streptomyces sp. 21So2-11 TaxID=3144408 RepID=UPI0032193E36